VEPLLKG